MGVFCRSTAHFPKGWEAMGVKNFGDLLRTTHTVWKFDKFSNLEHKKKKLIFIICIIIAVYISLVALILATIFILLYFKLFNNYQILNFTFSENHEWHT